MTQPALRISLKESSEKHKLHEKDCGSTVVQIFSLTEKIINLTEHLKTRSKDIASKMGLFKAINRRKKHLSYLHRQDAVKHAEIKKELKIR